jgi:hypothetical protein
MTYDELLDKVDNLNTGITRHINALRAVVELHQPKVESDLNDYLLCEECTEISWRNEKWPCHTIKAIEESLV